MNGVGGHNSLGDKFCLVLVGLKSVRDMCSCQDQNWCDLMKRRIHPVHWDWRLVVTF